MTLTFVSCMKQDVAKTKFIDSVTISPRPQTGRDAQGPKTCSRDGVVRGDAAGDSFAFRARSRGDMLACSDGDPS